MYEFLAALRPFVVNGEMNQDHIRLLAVVFPDIDLYVKENDLTDRKKSTHYAFHIAQVSFAFGGGCGGDLPFRTWCSISHSMRIGCAQRFFTTLFHSIFWSGLSGPSRFVLCHVDVPTSMQAAESCGRRGKSFQAAQDQDWMKKETEFVGQNYVVVRYLKGVDLITQKFKRIGKCR